MRWIVWIGFLLLILPGISVPGTAAAASGWTTETGMEAPRRGTDRWDVTLSAGYVSKSIQTGAGSELSDQTDVHALPAIQQGISVSRGPWTFSVANTRHAGNKLQQRGQLSELDYSLDFSQELNQLSLDLGYSHATYPHDDSQPGRSGYLGMSFTGPWSPSIGCSWYSYPGDGIYPSIYFSFSRTLGWFQLDGGGGWYCARTNDYFYELDDSGLDDVYLSLSLPWELREGLTLTPSFSASFTTRRALREELENDDTTWWGIALEKQF